MDKINWVVAHKTIQYDHWQYVQGFENLESARAEMNLRPTNPKYNNATFKVNFVGVFRNRGIDLKDSNYRYFLDLRDKSKFPIGPACSGLINSTNSDFTINRESE